MGLWEWQKGSIKLLAEVSEAKNLHEAENGRTGSPSGICPCHKISARRWLLVAPSLIKIVCVHAAKSWLNCSVLSAVEKSLSSMWPGSTP